MTHLPFSDSLALTRLPGRCATRHLGLVMLHILLCQRRALLLVRLEMRLLAVAVAVRNAMALETLLERIGRFVALRT